MPAADESLISHDGLNERRIALKPSALAFKPRFVKNTPPLPSYIETAVRFTGTHVVLRLETTSGEPQREQLAFVQQVEDRYLLYLGGALVLMKPAFREHVGEQDALRALQEEFVPTGLFVSAVDDEAVRWEMLFRCKTAPMYEFRVRYEGLRAVRLLVDLTA